MSDKQNNERRKYKRVSSIFIITYRLRSPLGISLQSGDTQYAAVAMDISEGGLGIDVDRDIPPFTQVKAKFELINKDVSKFGEETFTVRKFELDAQTRYSDPTNKKSFRIGILFMGVSSEDKEFISKFVKDQGLKTNKS